jgi:hypothetical protein
MQSEISSTAPLLYFHSRNLSLQNKELREMNSALRIARDVNSSWPAVCGLELSMSAVRLEVLKKLPLQAAAQFKQYQVIIENNTV